MVIELSLNCQLLAFYGYEYQQILPSQLIGC